ncbi:MAG: hypothetical protein ACFBRM_10850 [Pikeienuella sp.]
MLSSVALLGDLLQSSRSSLCGLGSLLNDIELALGAGAFGLASGGEIGPLAQIEEPREIGAFGDPFAQVEPTARVVEPVRVAVVREPVPRGALDAFGNREVLEILL